LEEEEMMGMQTGSQTAAAPGDARSRARQTLARDERGQSLVEFALVAPLLFTILLGVIKFGITFNNYLTLTNATNIATQQLSISRGQITDPCGTATSAFYKAAPFLTQGSLSFTITMGSHAYTTTSCTAGLQYLVAAQTTTIKVTYPCNLSLYGVNFAPSCTLTAQTAEAIQ
jgi:Flp pilus assembly protein TadG